MPETFHITFEAKNSGGVVATGKILIAITVMAPEYDGSFDNKNFTFTEGMEIEPIDISTAFTGANLKFSIQSGLLPPGLNLDAETGIVSGIPEI